MTSYGTMDQYPFCPPAESFSDPAYGNRKPFGCCLFRSTDLLIVILRGDYETITGICTAVTSQPFHRYHKIELTDSQGNAVILLLGKQVKIKPDGCYCFYFRKASRPSLGSEYLDASLSTDLFLGYDSALPGNRLETKNQDTAE